MSSLRRLRGSRRHRIVEVLIQPTPGGHAGFLGVAVERGVGQLDAQRNIVDGHAEEVLEEHDAGLAPRDLGEIARSLFDESVDQQVGFVADLGSSTPSSERARSRG